jgi:hypothetical protein
MTGGRASLVYRRALGTAALLAALAFAAPADSLGQEPRTAIHPSVIHVGDIFRAVIAVDVPAGTRVVFPDTLGHGEHLEAAGRLELRTDSGEDGGRRIMAAYPMAAWRPGATALPPVTVRIIGDGCDRPAVARFPEFEISSVLPQDTAGIEPKDLKDVLGGERLIWPWLLAALLLAALIAALLLRRRRRTAPVDPRTGTVDPRAAALAALAEKRGQTLARNGEVRRMYIEIADTLRYLIAVEMPELSHDRTTTELLPLLRRAMNEARARDLAALLHRADMVKFARARRTPDDALGDWRGARAWVEDYVPPAPEPPLEASGAPAGAAAPPADSPPGDGPPGDGPPGDGPPEARDTGKQEPTQ